jgi:hypothetical protein
MAANFMMSLVLLQENVLFQLKFSNKIIIVLEQEQ